MIQTLPEKKRRYRYIHELFKDNERHWEEVDSKTEYARLASGFYEMENRSSGRWNYYAIDPGEGISGDFTIKTRLECLRYDDCNQLGIIWGMDKKGRFANRFSISADGSRIVIMCFERDHRNVLYRFQIKNTDKKIRSNYFTMQIDKSGPYYHFFLNEQLINIVHEFHLSGDGNLMGYYIEPGIRMRSDVFDFTSE